SAARGAAAAQGGGARHGDERVGGAFGGRVDEVCQLISVRLQILKEAFELGLHRVHLLAHVENDLDAGEVYAEVARERQNQLQPRQIRIGVEERVCFRPRTLNTSL